MGHQWMYFANVVSNCSLGPSRLHVVRCSDILLHIVVVLDRISFLDKTSLYLAGWARIM